MYIYLNGRIVHQAEAAISPFDHGYMYGLGLFETFRVENGHPFLLDDHFQRLTQGLEQIGVQWTITRTEAIRIIEQLLKANGLNSAYVRWNVSAGTGAIGLYTGIYEEPTVIIYMKEAPPLTSATKEAIILRRRRNTPEGDYRLKSHHYLNNVLAKREIGPSMAQEGIFLTEDGYVAEGIVSNLFWIKGNTVYTPASSLGILDGITRRYILTVLEKEGIKVEIGSYSQQHFMNADAAFMTNSIQECVPISKCGQTVYATDHLIIKRLKEAFRCDRERLWSRKELTRGC